MTTTHFGRLHQRQRLFQTFFAFAAALIVALSLTALLSARSHAAIDCTARSIHTSSAACDAPTGRN